MELGFTSAEASLEYCNALRGPEINFEQVDAYQRFKADKARESSGNGGAPRADAGRRAIDWHDLAQTQPPDRTWFVEQWLSTGATLIAGPGGTGKSLLAQTMATALALGVAYVETVPAPQSVLYWACEDDRDELWRRQLAICRYFDVDLTALPAHYIVEPRLGRSNGLTCTQYGALVWTDLYAELREQVNDYHAAVLILDNIGQVFGGNENDRHHVTEFLNGLLGLTASPLAVVLLGHPSKAAGSEYSGSTAWQNAVRMRWFMGDKPPDQPQSDDEEVADPAVRYLAKRKANYTIHDCRKLLYEDGVYAPQAVPLPPMSERYGGRQSRAEAILLSAIDAFKVHGIRSTASASTPDYLPKLVLSSNMAHGFTRGELITAMQRLRTTGALVDVQCGKYPNRSPKYSLGRPPEPAQAECTSAHK